MICKTCFGGTSHAAPIGQTVSGQVTEKTATTLQAQVSMYTGHRSTLAPI